LSGGKKLEQSSLVRTYLQEKLRTFPFPLFDLFLSLSKHHASLKARTKISDQSGSIPPLSCTYIFLISLAYRSSRPHAWSKWIVRNPEEIAKFIFGKKIVNRIFGKELDLGTEI
jgi:hypothetical protein